MTAENCDCENSIFYKFRKRKKAPNPSFGAILLLGSSKKHQPAMIYKSFSRQLRSRKAQDALHLITFRRLAVAKNLSQISSFGIFQSFLEPI